MHADKNPEAFQIYALPCTSTNFAAVVSKYFAICIDNCSWLDGISWWPLCYYVVVTFSRRMRNTLSNILTCMPKSEQFEMADETLWGKTAHLVSFFLLHNLLAISAHRGESECRCYIMHLSCCCWCRWQRQTGQCEFLSTTDTAMLFLTVQILISHLIVNAKWSKRWNVPWHKYTWAKCNEQLHFWYFWPTAIKKQYKIRWP